MWSFLFFCMSKCGPLGVLKAVTAWFVLSLFCGLSPCGPLRVSVCCTLSLCGVLCVSAGCHGAVCRFLFSAGSDGWSPVCFCTQAVAGHGECYGYGYGMSWFWYVMVAFFRLIVVCC